MAARSHDPAASARRARTSLGAALVPWFLAGRRDLPWRRTRDPYAIWISEAMLQQTRVEVVIPYYARFLARLPDVRALAQAEEEDVLALWSGLGYYARARSLRNAARGIVERHGGVLPRTREAWLALPGVGPYTAGAVLSIAFGQPEALVDGNVQRVLARLFALEAPRGSTALASTCWELARILVPGTPDEPAPGDWNQALMELGARVCTPRAPRCGDCPLRAHCRAAELGRAEALPVPAERPAPLDVRLETFVVRSEAGLLLARRPSGGRMAGLLELPTRELVTPGELPRLWPAETGLRLVPGAELGELRHTITRHRIRVRVRAARLQEAPRIAEWRAPAQLAAAPLTGLARKVLALDAVRSGSFGDEGVPGPLARGTRP